MATMKKGKKILLIAGVIIVVLVGIFFFVPAVNQWVKDQWNNLTKKKVATPTGQLT